MFSSCRQMAHGPKSWQAALEKSNTRRGVRTETRSSTIRRSHRREESSADQRLGGLHRHSCTPRRSLGSAAPAHETRQLGSEDVARRATDCLLCGGPAARHQPRWHGGACGRRRPRAGTISRNQRIPCGLATARPSTTRRTTAIAIHRSGLCRSLAGSRRLLVRFDDPSRRSLRREFATDGQRFYFTVARDESDVWAMELLKK